MTADLTIRDMQADDLDAVLALLGDSLGWNADDDPRFAPFFRWKHHENAFGRSFAWVAESGGAVVGFRTFMRWAFEVDGRIVTAVRAVDTATDPAHRGAGIFTKLTMHGLEVMARDGVGIVFNTPNNQSRPGYLKMGWRVVGRVPVAIRPRTVRGVIGMSGRRPNADRWSLPTDVGEPAADALADTERVEDLLARREPVSGYRTATSAAFLQWRYGGFEPLGYRGLWGPDCLVLFRLRRRGDAIEAVINHVVAAAGARRRAYRVAASVVRDGRADYGVAVGTAAPIAGFVRMPRSSTVLTSREVTEIPEPDLARWHLTMGDVELF